jgi:hypothetical protein
MGIDNQLAFPRLVECDDVSRSPGEFLSHVDRRRPLIAARGAPAVQGGSSPFLCTQLHPTKKAKMRSQLHYLGREYPDASYGFNNRLHRCFAAHSGIEDEEKLRGAIAKAQFIKKELEALYFLKKVQSQQLLLSPPF